MRSGEGTADTGSAVKIAKQKGQRRQHCGKAKMKPSKHGTIGLEVKMKKDKLKRCPFCGSKDVELKRYHDLFGVECNNCYRPSWSYWSTKRIAVEAWNKRTGSEK